MIKMSHKNYAKYAQAKSEKNNEVILDKTSIDTPEITNELPAHDCSVNNEIIEENKVQNNEEIKQPDPIPAVVVNCAKLRVRKAPDVEADIYGTIEKGTELTVDNGEETHGDFYKVYTVINDVLIEGYCMKKFIKLN